MCVCVPTFTFSICAGKHGGCSLLTAPNSKLSDFVLMRTSTSNIIVGRDPPSSGDVEGSAVETFRRGLLLVD